MAPLPLSPLDLEIIGLLGDQAGKAVLGMARVLTCFAWLPYLSSGAISSKMTRSAVALLVVIGIWPVVENVAVPPTMPEFFAAAGVEVLVGTALGLMMALPFHAFHAFGAIVDNQRGASISSALDPLNGIEATETANLLQMFSAVIFLQTGGLDEVLQVIHNSYGLAPAGARFFPDAASVHAYMGNLLAAAVRMSAPVLLLLFLMEIVLGILSRFAQQMNAFSVALAVKSLLAFLALLVYLMPVMIGEVPALWGARSPLQILGTP